MRYARECFQAIMECKKPVIAAINGPALGAGLAVAASCDILLTGENALLGLPEIDVGLVMVADEEHGNVHGIDFLLAKDIFRKGDLVVVPDHGSTDGSELEVVEKGIAWIDVEVMGKQTHASTPDKGVNALEAASKFMLAAVAKLRGKYAARDELFDPPRSTFEATRCESNGPNVNTVAGKQRFAFDYPYLALCLYWSREATRIGCSHPQAHDPLRSIRNDHRRRTGGHQAPRRSVDCVGDGTVECVSSSA